SVGMGGLLKKGGWEVGEIVVMWMNRKGVFDDLVRLLIFRVLEIKCEEVERELCIEDERLW
uniref:hypothetical protein n=1 Tax=Siminovitchia fortis TaxID=254758 RepID=UPI001C931283